MKTNRSNMTGVKVSAIVAALLSLSVVETQAVVFVYDGSSLPSAVGGMTYTSGNPVTPESSFASTSGGILHVEHTGGAGRFAFWEGSPGPSPTDGFDVTATGATLELRARNFNDGASFNDNIVTSFSIGGTGANSTEIAMTGNKLRVAWASTLTVDGDYHSFTTVRLVFDPLNLPAVDVYTNGVLVSTYNAGNFPSRWLLGDVAGGESVKWEVDYLAVAQGAFVPGDPNDPIPAALLPPVPEPATAGLLGVGALVLVASRRVWRR